VEYFEGNYQAKLIETLARNNHGNPDPVLAGAVLLDVQAAMPAGESWTNVAVGKLIGVTEGTVRNWLKVAEFYRRTADWAMASDLLDSEPDAATIYRNFVNSKIREVRRFEKAIQTDKPLTFDGPNRSFYSELAAAGNKPVPEIENDEADEEAKAVDTYKKAKFAVAALVKLRKEFKRERDFVRALNRATEADGYSVTLSLSRLDAKEAAE
jgi:hypothetical protein